MFIFFKVNNLDKVKEFIEKYSDNKELMMTYMLYKGNVIIDLYKLRNIAVSLEYYDVLKDFYMLDKYGYIEYANFFSQLSKKFKQYDKKIHLLTLNLRRKLPGFHIPILYSKLPYSCCDKNVYYVEYIDGNELDDEKNPSGLDTTHIILVGVGKNMWPNKVINAGDLEGYNIIVQTLNRKAKPSWWLEYYTIPESPIIFTVLKDHTNNNKTTSVLDYLQNTRLDNTFSYLFPTIFFSDKLMAKLFFTIENDSIKFKTKVPKTPLKNILAMPERERDSAYNIKVTELKNITLKEHKLEYSDKPKIFNELLYLTRTFEIRKIMKRQYYPDDKINTSWMTRKHRIINNLEGLHKFVIVHSSFSSYYSMLKGYTNNGFNKLFNIVSDVKLLSLQGVDNNGNVLRFPIIWKFTFKQNNHTYYVVNTVHLMLMKLYYMRRLSMNEGGLFNNNCELPVFDKDRIDIINACKEYNVSVPSMKLIMNKYSVITSYDEHYIFYDPKEYNKPLYMVGKKVIKDSELNVLNSVKHVYNPEMIIKFDGQVFVVGGMLNIEHKPTIHGVFLLTDRPENHIVTSVDYESYFMVYRYIEPESFQYF